MVVTRSKIRNNVAANPVYVLKQYSNRRGPSTNIRSSVSPLSGPLGPGSLGPGSIGPGSLGPGSLGPGSSVTDDSLPGPPVPDTSVSDSSATDTSVTTTAEVDQGQEEMGQEEVVEKQEFKSIIRTRSQKLNEAKMYHENMITLLENHWNTYNREPDAANPALADYIQNLRSIDSANLRPEFVALVTERLPWFKWKLTTKTEGWSRFAGNVAKYTFLVTLVLWAAYLQVKLTEKGFVTTLYSKVNNFRLLNDISFS